MKYYMVTLCDGILPKKLLCIAFLLGIKRESCVKGMDWESATWSSASATEIFELYPNYKKVVPCISGILISSSSSLQSSETYYRNACLCLGLCYLTL